MSKSSGKIWPYAIGGSIIFIFSACVATIIITSKMPVEKSDTYMMGYHEANDKVNEIIKEAIEFNKKYKIEYISDEQNSMIRYRVSDINSNPINNADLKVVITRPDNHKYDLVLDPPSVTDGIYTFSAVKLPLEGRWDVMAKVNIEGIQKFYNIKTDTRNREIVEY